MTKPVHTPRIGPARQQLPSPPLSTTQWRPVVILEKGSSANDQSEDDVDGAAYNSENEKRKDGHADPAWRC